MNILSLENLTKSFSDRKLFDHTSFYLQEGEKVGIIGINGTGKSTLLKIAAGIEEPDEGKRTVANHVVIRYLPQNPEFDGRMGVLEHVMQEMSADVHWDMEGEAKNMLKTLGIQDLEQKIGELSGGQRKRLALAEILLKPCDILILDEPTNHLDHAMANWLEQYLKSFRGTLIMVTHDRYFLDSVSNRILEIDKGKFYSYDTNYSGFLELKAQREEMELASERKRQSILRVELEWVKRGARARSTKQKARLERYEDLKNQKGPQTDGQVEMSSVSTRMGNTTIEVEGLCKSFGERTLIRDFSYIFLKNDRIGFVGTNGCGKTTLMKLLTGRMEPDAGSIKVGQTIKIGYYSQEIETKKEAGIAYMDPNMRVIDYIRETAEFVRTEDGLISASAMLERFLFPPQEQYSLIGKLSGGEKRRLNLLRVLMEAPNVLILDEPTNDLDITTLTILEDYLDHYQGIVISVSHDRYFLDRTVRRIFAFEEGGRIRQYEGGYTDYIQKAGEAAQMSLSGDGGAKSQANESDVSGQETGGKEAYAAYRASRERKLKFSYKEQREYASIEGEIEQLEEKIQQLEDEILKAARDFVKLNELTREKEATEQLLEEKMERWEYLEDLAQQIRAGSSMEG
jgi:ATP-binding cassette subfamily F protein uup